MAGQYSAILATDYNVIQSKVALVLGSGTGNTGYGQTVTSSQVSSRTNVTYTQWNNLRTDLLKVRQHQTGTDMSAFLNVASATENVTDADRTAFNQMASDAQDQTNRLITPPASQATRENLVSVQQRATAWQGSLTQTVTVTFADFDAARYFFNTGSQMEFTLARTLGTPNSKNNTWTTMFTTMGKVSFKHDSTACSGTGDPATTIGYYQLDTTDKVIFQKLAPGGAYADNRFFILARKGNVGLEQIIFTLSMQDASGGGVDENPDGLLTSTVQVYYATGDNVSVIKPPATTTGLA
jgi:uncharacterized membrane protein